MLLMEWLMRSRDAGIEDTGMEYILTANHRANGARSIIGMS